jgi:hypothetical protein
MLLLEESRFRRRTFRHILRGLRPSRSPWRQGPAERRFATRPELVGSLAAGAGLYTRSLLRER